MTAALQAVIVGAGPAGVRAAQTLVAHGVRPVVVDEAPRWGGQIYRQPPAGFTRPKRTLYGFEAGRAEALHSAMAGILDRVDYRPDTLVWSAEGGRLDLLCQGQMSTLPYRQLIVATGATDRVLPFPGWTLPGVYTLGAAQVALKYQGCAIGARVVFAGTGPLLYLVAYQYAKAGAQVVAVLDTASFKDKAAAVPAMLRQPALFAKGLYYLGWLRAHGVAVHQGVRLLRATGGAQVAAMHWRDEHAEHALACDAVGFGYALRPETQLADLLGCRFAYDGLQRAALPERDGAGRSSVPGVYLAGDGAGIMGADAAEWAGERAALALLADAGKPVAAARAAELEARLARTAAFRVGLERAFPFPQDWAVSAPDELLVCRCENITAGELRQCVSDTGAREMNRLKAQTRVGMGRCQGRTCGVAAAEILAQACATSPDAVGRLRGQAPIKPLPFAAKVQTQEEAA
ncbi:NADPH-dependent 2,4-dienoyl-CoA reductase, sulfur reductase [Polaromonas sp. OV174]|uniref:FAD/NAD(P)-dependent oxidoreductase n=1 Tax=Polaromonas sp. OV174 TaxID=1855300 RepID=UPI0008F06125|nr:NAD(P)/FAD-dependent oxidoreductase [Polaromonas sp. OV174]SFB69223.1 NADPH-dependent 2,4-dienoyl-CoA reductase, sulfur reductase [Polaromonas sp. OV174]